MDEIKNLKLEIDVLKRRISVLEAKERRRMIVKIIKIIIIMAIIVVIAIYGYKFYQQLVDYYNQIKSFTENPLQSFIR